uniref:AlNc14C30G2827 protein n=1 Tax=Albugo laibachii Nc14 TaxID=890382 RepID=F0W7M1_9STRA|nr:AlNc14C30G2827 [Albugo laibachii Nc14]|eukprot:CCA17122.1 AlNc14C30G2827 [Albugo laibachii Nc14]
MALNANFMLRADSIDLGIQRDLTGSKLKTFTSHPRLHSLVMRRQYEIVTNAIKSEVNSDLFFCPGSLS